MRISDGEGTLVVTPIVISAAVGAGQGGLSGMLGIPGGVGGAAAGIGDPSVWCVRRRGNSVSVHPGHAQDLSGTPESAAGPQASRDAFDFAARIIRR